MLLELIFIVSVLGCVVLAIKLSSLCKLYDLLQKENDVLSAKLETSEERVKHRDYILEEVRENNSSLFTDYLKLHDEYTSLKSKSKKGKVKK